MFPAYCSTLLYFSRNEEKMNAYMSSVDLLVNNANFSFKGKLATLWFDK